MTAKLSDLRAKECGVLWVAEASHTDDCFRPLSLSELLAMLEAEGVLRREYDVAYSSRSDQVWRLVTEWLPREESSDVPKLTPEPSFGTSMTQESE